MLNRYPHSAQIKVSVEVDDGSGIPSYQTTYIDIPKGRYDPAPGTLKEVDYSGKFYCPVLDSEPFEYDGAVLIFRGKEYGIVNLFNYQTHCEIWLE